MLKIFTLSRCSLCTVVMPKTFRNHNTSLPSLEELKIHLSKENRKNDEWNKGGRKRRIFLRSQNKNIKAVQTILQKYNVNVSCTEKDAQIFTESPYDIEKKILVLQELKVPEITISLISNFIRGMYLPVKTYKAFAKIEPEVNLAENLMSWIENPNINSEPVKNLDENMILKKYYSECFAHYVKNELGLNETQTKRISYKRCSPVLFNSLRLLQKFLKFLKNDLGFSNTLIVKYYSLLACHPEHASIIYKMMTETFKEHALKLVQKYPKILEHDIKDLSNYISYLKEYEITPSMVKNTHQILHIDSTEFKRRVENLLNNPMTLVYKKHPRFLLLVRDYHIILPRIRYLEEKNLKYATIHSLTTFHNTLEQLITIKKMNKVNLKCFFESQFGKNAEELLERLKRHSCYTFVPLLPMLESLNYLKEHYSNEIIHKHIYAILYNKVDLQAAYEVIMKDPNYSQLPPGRLLSLCVYKIEEKYNFTGEGVLAPEKYAEYVKEESAEKKKDDIKE